MSDTSRTTPRALFFAEKIPYRYKAVLGAHLVHRFEKQFFLSLGLYIRLQIAHDRSSNNPSSLLRVNSTLA
jgi:hypothetical protein